MEAFEQQESIVERLQQPVRLVTGVGPRLVPLLQKLGLFTARDLLFFFPRDYEDVSELLPIEQLTADQPVSTVGTIEEIDLRESGAGRSVLAVLVRGDTKHLRAVWFNQPYMRQKLHQGQRVMLSGIPKQRGLCLQMTHPRVESLETDEVPTIGRILPKYGLTEGLTQNRLRRIISAVVDEFAPQLEEVLPADFRSAHQLCSIHRAMAEIHQPTNREDLEAARRRLVFQELLSLQLAVALRRWKLQQRQLAPLLTATAKIDARIRRLFAFELTPDQKQSIQEISDDMNRQTPMNRLLQGEVGSGKTVVAEYALLLAVAHGHQAAVMAPTEVLARQHVRILKQDLRQSRVRIGLLTGSLSASARQNLQQQLNDGKIDIVVGTQALLHDGLKFPRLGLVVIDEQHKFGVRQRAALKQAAIDPHYLVMTATPIPRSLTMTLFGDLDVSTLRTIPPGRQPIHTYLASEDQREKWWDFFRRKLREGRQGYVVAPRVEEDPAAETASAEQLFEHLSNGPLGDFRLDILHGRLSPSQKEAAMETFRRGETQVLVSTTVIEVGVDVPNATIMTIESGEHFGLAQLHQLRGRIRRGQFPGFLCVFAAPANPAATERLESFAATDDGFQLAELDFQQRGPGDIFGTSQHGIPPLRIANLNRDRKLLEEARRIAKELMVGSSPPFLEDRFSRLRQMVLRRYGDSLDLGDVG
jgi:ATP-dependent DNA helicase RecG